MPRLNNGDVGTLSTIVRYCLSEAFATAPTGLNVLEKFNAAHLLSRSRRFESPAYTPPTAMEPTTRGQELSMT